MKTMRILAIMMIAVIFTIFEVLFVKMIENNIQLVALGVILSLWLGIIFDIVINWWIKTKP